MSLVDEVYEQSIAVLLENSTPRGFTATVERTSNYYSVWSRDHAICAIASVLTGREDLIDTAKRGILNLLRNQIDHGQVPSYIEVENRRKVYGGLGSITSVDSNLWVAIAAAVLHRRTKDRRFLTGANMKRYQRFYRLFKAFDSNDCGLMEVPKAGDWADIFNRTYHVLYDECLYYESLKALQYLFKQGLSRTKDEQLQKKLRKRLRWVSRRKGRVKRRINENFWFTRESIPKVIEEYMIHDKLEPEQYEYYQSHLIPFKIYWQKRFESFGNILAIITGVADKQRARCIIRYVVSNKIHEPFPMRALSPPLYPRMRGWERIFNKFERPHEYHNGGIWPVIAGFWINAISRNGQKRLARRQLAAFADMIMKHGFREWFHGKTGEPKGRKKQAWSAAGYIIAYHSVQRPVRLFM